MQTEANFRMLFEQFNEGKIRVRVGVLDHIVEIADRLMPVNEEDELEFLHERTPQTLIQNTLTAWNCPDVRRASRMASFGATSASRQQAASRNDSVASDTATSGLSDSVTELLERCLD
jgi:hypothetical protein